jgi:hypothetical protein
VATGAIVIVAAVLIVLAMRRSMTAEDIEAELPVEDELKIPVPAHPHLEGHGPAA